MDKLPENSPETETSTGGSEQHPELSQLIEEANAKLAQAGADSAERSFGLGCVVFALPLLVAIVLLFVFQVLNLILALIVLFMGALAVAGMATLIAYNARARAIGNTYHSEIEPQIAQSLAGSHTDRLQFDRLAGEILPEGAPLRAYLEPVNLNPSTEER